MEEREAIERRGGPGIPTAFSLSRFVPLLKERIAVINPFTRMFLVQWITLLDSIPDLELVSYLPSFLGGLFRFLNDSAQDVVTSTQHVLERFLVEIKQIAQVKREIAANRQLSEQASRQASRPESKRGEQIGDSKSAEEADNQIPRNEQLDGQADHDSASDTAISDEPVVEDEEFIPGQDVFVDHPKIIEVVLPFLHDRSEHVQVTALRWVDGFFDISPEDLMPHVPELLNRVLPALSSEILQVRKAAGRVNMSLAQFIEDTIDEEEHQKASEAKALPTSVSDSKELHRRVGSDLGPGEKPSASDPQLPMEASKQPSRQPSPPKSLPETMISKRLPSLDYDATVNALTQQFLNNNEATRAAALSWLIMLQKKAPKKVLAAHDTTFPALLKTLADTSDTVVTRDLQLLCQISKHSDEAYFSFFMVNLLQLFADDRKLLDTRGALIVRQLCLNLSPERIFRTMAGCIEKHEVSVDQIPIRIINAHS